ALGPEGAAFGHGGTGGGGIPDLDKLPEPFRTVMEAAYGHGVGDVFLYAAPCALIAFVVTLFIKEVALKSSTTGNDSPQGEAAAGADPVEAEVPAAVGATGAVSEGAAGVTSVDTAAAVTPYGTGQDAVTPYGTTVRGVVRGAEG
ncbi:MFS transporter, partial [Streptomyces sp. DSM 41981]|nr:MFS transporter [Streptomyces sp. DSM 41981]